MVLDLSQFKIQIIHVQNSGVERRIIFEDEKDCKRFIQTLIHYKSTSPASRFAFRKRSKSERTKNDSPLVEIISYCLMPNHFHLLLKEMRVGGTSKFISKVSNSYTKYFNARHKRSGSLFKGRYRSAKIEEKLVPEISRFIHLDPQVKKIVRSIDKFPFSSYYEVINNEDGVSDQSTLLSLFNSITSFTEFTLDFNDYEASFENIKGLTLD